MPRSTGRSDCPFAARAAVSADGCTLFADACQSRRPPPPGTVTQIKPLQLGGGDMLGATAMPHALKEPLSVSSTASNEFIFLYVGQEQGPTSSYIAHPRRARQGSNPTDS